MSCGCSTPAIPCSGGNETPPQGIVREYPPIAAPLSCEAPFAIDRLTKKAYFYNDLATPPAWECVAFCGQVAPPPNPCTNQPTCTAPAIFGLSAGSEYRAELVMTSPPNCTGAIGTTSYQWYKRAGSTDTPISGATSANYLVPLSDTAGGAYLLKVTMTFTGCAAVTVESNTHTLTNENDCPTPVPGGMYNAEFRAGTNSSGSFQVGPLTSEPLVTGFPTGVTQSITGPYFPGYYTVSWSGVPTTAGQAWEIRVTGTNACPGKNATTITNVVPDQGSGTVLTANPACTTPTVGTVNLPQAIVGVPYYGTFQLLNATSYSFSGTFGAQFASSGLTQQTTVEGANLLVTLTGTPTAEVASAINVQVQAFNDCVGGSQAVASLTVKTGWTVLPSISIPASQSGLFSLSAVDDMSGGNCETGMVEFAPDGNFKLNGILPQGAWASPLTAGIGQYFWIKAEQHTAPTVGLGAGTATTSFGDCGNGLHKALNTWHQLNASVYFAIQISTYGTATSKLTYKLATAPDDARVIRTWDANNLDIASSNNNG